MLQFNIWHIAVSHLLPKLFTVKYSPVFWPTLYIREHLIQYAVNLIINITI